MSTCPRWSASAASRRALAPSVCPSRWPPSKIGSDSKALTPHAQAVSNNNIMTQGYQTRMQGLGSQASILNQQYGNQLNAWSAQQQASASNSSGMMGGIGSMVGMGMVAF